MRIVAILAIVAFHGALAELPQIGCGVNVYVLCTKVLEDPITITAADVPVNGNANKEGCKTSGVTKSGVTYTADVYADYSTMTYSARYCTAYKGGYNCVCDS